MLAWFGLSFLDKSAKNLDNNGEIVESETDSWNLYKIEGTDLSVKYPQDVSLEQGEIQLLVENTPINELDYPGFDKEEVIATVESLKNGNFGFEDIFVLEKSKKVRNLPAGRQGLGKISAQEYMVLGRFEVCDVTLERKLLFFENDRRVIITIKGNKDLISSTMPEYFNKNEENCGNDLIWNFEKMDEFYQTLSEGKGSLEAQKWFKSFDTVVETLGVNIVKQESARDLSAFDNYEKVKGRWTSVDDEKSILDISDKYKADFYDGVAMTEGPFVLYNEYPITRETPEDGNGKYMLSIMGGQQFFYEIVKLDEHNLEMIYLDRGNTLKYIR